MKENDENAPKADRKGKKKDNDFASLEKKLVKEISRKLRKELDQKMDEVLKQVKKETKRALREVLEETRRGANDDSHRGDRKLQEASPDDLPISVGEAGAEEITVDIEPDELHLGEDLQVVSVGSTSDEEIAPDKASSGRSGSRGKGREADAAEAAGASSAAGSRSSAGKSKANATPTRNRRTATPAKKGTAEREIGSDTGTGSAVSPKETA
jgi:hypothetical protein